MSSFVPPSGDGLTSAERTRRRPGLDIPALEAVVRELPEALRRLVLLRYAQDAGSDAWRVEHNAQVSAAGLPISWRIPERGEYAVSWSLGGNPRLAAHWDALERSANG